MGQSYEKASEVQKKNVFFFSLPSASNFGEAKVTKSREQKQIKFILICFVE